MFHSPMLHATWGNVAVGNFSETIRRLSWFDRMAAQCPDACVRPGASVPQIKNLTAIYFAN
jgi:hypothetical protein